MRLQFKKHKVFEIPKDRLDLFFIKLENISCNTVRFETKWLFEKDDDNYEVIISIFGSYPFVEDKLKEFVEEMKKSRLKGKIHDQD